MLKVLWTLRNTLAHARSHTPDPGIHMGNGSATEVAASRGGARRDASFLTSRQPAWDGQGEGIGPRAPRWSPDATSWATQAPLGQDSGPENVADQSPATRDLPATVPMAANRRRPPCCSTIALQKVALLSLGLETRQASGPRELQEAPGWWGSCSGKALVPASASAKAAGLKHTGRLPGQTWRPEQRAQHMGGFTSSG